MLMNWNLIAYSTVAFTSLKLLSYISESQAIFFGLFSL